MISTEPIPGKSSSPAPHIPLSLTIFVVATVFTQLMGSLLYQPVTYWQNPQNMNANLPLKFLFQGGPSVYLAIVFIYLLVITALLRKLNTFAGFILACCLFCFHWVILLWSFQSSPYPLFELLTFNERSVFLTTLVVILLIVFVLLLSFHPPQKVTRWLWPAGLVLLAGWVLFICTAQVRLAFPPASIWHTVTFDHSPGSRTGSALAYDTKRHRAILFGGISSRSETIDVYETNTWVWDGKDWQEFDTKIAPSGRYNHAMAYDPIQDLVYLYGGVDRTGAVLSDMWAWDGTTWTRMCPVCNPAGRSKHAMTYDPDRKATIVYGGNGEKIYSEAWSWDGKAWSYIGFSSSNPAFYDDLLIYDSNTKKIIGFIGGDWGGTWEWAGDKWSRLDLAVQPPFRSFAAYAQDPSTHKIYLFGGSRDEKIFSDTWVLDGQNWVKLTPPLSPPARSNPVSFYDEVRHSFVVFGGDEFGYNLNDMWEIKLLEGAE